MLNNRSNLATCVAAIHSTDEYVEIASAMQVAQVLGRFILDWCEPAE
jgi:acetylornithine deacetylase/succinyl-diaminopimelate desuccinylase-like protein